MMLQKYRVEIPKKNKINKRGDFLNEWGGFFNEWFFASNKLLIFARFYKNESKYE